MASRETVTVTRRAWDQLHTDVAELRRRVARLEQLVYDPLKRIPEQPKPRSRRGPALHGREYSEQLNKQARERIRRRNGPG